MAAHAPALKDVEPAGNSPPGLGPDADQLPGPGAEEAPRPLGIGQARGRWSALRRRGW